MNRAAYIKDYRLKDYYMIKKIDLRLIILGLVSVMMSQLSLNAQISEPGTPAYDVEISDKLYIEAKEHFYFQPKARLKSAQKLDKGESLKFAHQFTVDYSLDNSGEWTTLNDGTKVWRIVISSQGAYSLNLIFDRYKLPEGAKLFIYNTDRSEVLGAFTHANNQPSGILATSPIRGDQVIVEYQEPSDVKEKAELLIGAVNHDYLNIYNLKLSEFFGEADQECDVDITCFEEGKEMIIKRAVVRLIMNGTDLCTGTLINNTGTNKKQYIITAAHCFRPDKTGSTALVHFNYEIPQCANIIEGYYGHSLSGGVPRVLEDDLDIALLEMNNTPPAYYRPYLAGWTLSANPPSPFKAIHHPWGDVKKIATFDGELEASSFNIPANYPYTQVDDVHWKVPEWTSSTTEPGSSGGPLFDGNNLFVGTLSGGAAVCTNPVDDYYTQFYKSWDDHFKAWLDPINSGNQSLEGTDPYGNSSFKRLSNIEFGDVPISTEIAEGGFLTGHNASQNTIYAERFTNIKSARIKGVYFAPSEVKWGSNQTFNLGVWQGDIEPEVLIHKKVGIQFSEIGNSDLDSSEVHYFEFDTPVNVEGNFFVGYEINYEETPVDTLAVYYSVRNDNKHNSMLVYDNVDGWSYASEIHEYNNYSLWLDVLADLVVYQDTQVPEAETSSVNIYPVPLKGHILFLNSNGKFVERFEIYDYLGRMVASDMVKLTGSKIPIETGGLPAGVYVLKIYLEGEEQVKSFVVQ